jgi:hypothetical protein
VADFVVVETVGKRRRILLLIDDLTEAQEIALELRRRGIRAEASRMVRGLAPELSQQLLAQ